MIRLDGCRPAPLSSYMVGMGVFRLTAEQKDPDVRAFWERDRLVLETGCGKEDLVDFLLHEYEPSPVISPWSLNKYNSSVRKAGSVMGLPRMYRYREAVDSTAQVLRAFRESEGLDGGVVKEDISGESKLAFVRLCRNMWPDAAVEWLDAAAVLMPDRLSGNPLFGETGNDGNFDIPENFAARLAMVFDDRLDVAREWLEAAMFRKGAALAELTTFGHDPRGSGRPNSGSGYMGRDVSNPWEHVLMVEGMMMFAGGISRRTGRHAGRSAFPFAVGATKAGYATAADEKDRGEIWLPLWSRPASYGETRLVLREGRASYGNRKARTGADFALAAASLGVERGIDGFLRFGVLGRKGGKKDRPYHMSVDLGTVRVGDVPEARLVRDVAPWYERILRFVTRDGNKAPQSLKAAVRQFEGRIIDMCKSPGPQSAQSLLVATGRLERLVSGRAWPDGSGVEPFSGSLSADWLGAADDGTAEFRLAAAAASVRGAGDVGPIRENLEEVKREKGRWAAKPGSASCVWREGAALAANLGRVCVRRAIDGKAAKLGALPLDGNLRASLGDVEEFLAGVLDEEKIANLLLPLSMVRADGQEYERAAGGENRVPIPAAYALAKSVYGTPGVPVDMSSLALLGAGRVAEALGSMRRRARASGMLDGRVPAGNPPDGVAERLLGSLVFPVGPADRRRLLGMAAMREPPSARVVS